MIVSDFKNVSFRSAATHNENKENKEPEPEPAQQAQGDHLGEILILNTTIQELRSKLESVRHLEEEKSTLEDGNYKVIIKNIKALQFLLFYYLAERDNALADLELKEIEVARVISQIEELKSVFEKEETLRYE